VGSPWTRERPSSSLSTVYCLPSTVYSRSPSIGRRATGQISAATSRPCAGVAAVAVGAEPEIEIAGGLPKRIVIRRSRSEHLAGVIGGLLSDGGPTLSRDEAVRKLAHQNQLGMNNRPIDAPAPFDADSMAGTAMLRTS